MALICLCFTLYIQHNNLIYYHYLLPLGDFDLIRLSSVLFPEDLPNPEKINRIIVNTATIMAF